MHFSAICSTAARDYGTSNLGYNQLWIEINMGHALNFRKFSPGTKHVLRLPFSPYRYLFECLSLEQLEGKL